MSPMMDADYNPPAGPMEIRVVEWPQKGAASRWHGKERGVGWWVAEFRQNRGYYPLSGPYRTRDEAMAHVDEPVVNKSLEERRQYDARWSRDRRAAALFNELRGGLKDYGVHKNGCPLQGAPAVVPYRRSCSCGLGDLLKNADEVDA